MDELLSTYLVRRAHCQGLSPHRFMARGLPGVAIWNRDIDSSLSAAVSALIAEYCNLTEPEIKAMTLYDLAGCDSPADPDWPHYQSWINAVGIYHRLRRRFGLQYCPLCLRVEPVFHRIWRLAFVFCCPEHGVLLRNCCPSCGMPVMPHRARIDITLCWKCGTSLSAGNVVDSGMLPVALETQRFMMRCIECDEISLGSSAVSQSEYLRAVVAVLRVVKERMHSHPSLWNFGVPIEAVRAQVKFLGVLERLALFTMLLEVLSDWPANFLHFSSAAGVTQIAFGRRRNVPQWLTDVVAQLPVRLRTHNGATEANFVRYVRRLENEGGTKCRALRAQALMLAAKGQYGNR